MAAAPKGIKLLKNEEWVKLSVTRDGVTYKTHMLLSNHGRMVSNAFGEWRLLSNTNLVSGFPAYNFRAYTDKTEATIATESKLTSKIESADKKLAKLKKQLAKAVKKSEQNAINKEMKQVHAIIVSLKKDRADFLRADVESRMKPVHIIYHKEVAKNFIGLPKDKNKKYVIHLDFNKQNNFYKNLRWADSFEVNHHNQRNPLVIAGREGRVATKTHYALNPDKVGAIRKLIKEGVSVSKIAAKYKVADMTIHRIKRGESWPEVKAAK